MTDNPFLLIPLPLIRKLIYQKETINDIHHTGIYCTSQRINIDEENALKQFIYCMYRAKDELPTDLVDGVEGEFPFNE